VDELISSQASKRLQQMDDADQIQGSDDDDDGQSLNGTVHGSCYASCPLI